MFKKSMKQAWNVVKRGNMLMLAIGLLLGAAFGAVVSSLANDVIMAAIKQLINPGPEKIEDWQTHGIYWGKFIAAVLYFIIVAFFIFIGLTVVFLIVTARQEAKERKNPKPITTPAPTTEELILLELQKLNNSKK